VAEGRPPVTEGGPPVTEGKPSGTEGSPQPGILQGREVRSKTSWATPGWSSARVCKPLSKSSHPMMLLANIMFADGHTASSTPDLF
jgi:prepilin-type processing-associated H-X9-DG protein